LRDDANRLAVRDEGAIQPYRVGRAREDESPSGRPFLGGCGCRFPCFLVVVVAAAADGAEREYQRGQNQEEPERLSRHIVSFFRV
jgi:hypothetical protein